jgi:hypothetical protein
MRRENDHPAQATMRRMAIHPTMLQHGERCLRRRKRQFPGHQLADANQIQCNCRCDTVRPSGPASIKAIDNIGTRTAILRESPRCSNDYASRMIHRDDEAAGGDSRIEFLEFQRQTQRVAYRLCRLSSLPGAAFFGCGASRSSSSRIPSTMVVRSSSGHETLGSSGSYITLQPPVARRGATGQ